jgi:glutathione S-transferase
MKKRNEAKHAALQSWREKYETDPEVTQRTIAKAVGMSREYVGMTIRNEGWYRPADVKLKAIEIVKNEKKARDYIASQRPTPADIFRAAPSIWAIGRGVAVTTSRPHIRVSA